MRSYIYGLGLLSALGLALSASTSAKQTSRPFDPSLYPKKTAKCKAFHRQENVEKDIEISYVDVNPQAEKTIIMVHGWPGLWSNWWHQIEEFKDEYHIIVPTHRGIGESTHPGDVESSGQSGDLVGDLVCVLQNAGVDKAICLGHDWGAQVCWEAGRMRPDVFEAVASAVVPYMHASGWFFTPLRVLVWLFPSFAYQKYFRDHTLAAAEELNKDIRRSIRAIYRDPESTAPLSFLKSYTTFLGAYGDSEITRSTFLSQEEEDYLVQQYSIQGFYNSLQFYTHGNRYGSWKFSNAHGNHTIVQPTLSIYPTLDAVANWEKVEKLLGSAKYLPNFTRATIPAAHWVQLEKPAEFNAVLRNWLNTLPGIARIADTDDGAKTQQHHASDEL